MREKMIEEMARDICTGCRERHKCENNNVCAMAEIVATYLYNEDYRKESEVVAEVFEELERECSKVKGYRYSYGNLRVLIETIKEKHKGE